MLTVTKVVRWLVRPRYSIVALVAIVLVNMLDHTRTTLAAALVAVLAVPFVAALVNAWADDVLNEEG